MTMKLLRACTLGAGLIVTSAGYALFLNGPATAEVLATVNGQDITDEDLKLAAEDLGASVPQQLQGKARDAYLLDYLIDGTLVAQKAAADKVDQDPEFAKRLAYYREKVLMETLLTKVAKEAATPEKMQATYDEAAKAQKPETEIHARHILVATQAEAEAALKRVKAGEDFAKVAKEVSKDGADNGGDLGWFTKDKMIPEFADAAFKLNEGQISDPVKTQFGWHIIKVEGKRQSTFPSYDEVKGQVAAFVAQKAQAEMIEQLRKDAKIVRKEPAPASVPGGTAPQGAQSPANPTSAAAPASAPAASDKK